MTTPTKRYLIFGGNEYRQGGWHDLQGAAETLENAIAIMSHLDYQNRAWWHIVDTETMAIVNELSIASGTQKKQSEGEPMTTPTPADFAPVGKRFTIIVEVTEPDIAQAFVALSLGIPIDDSRLVAGCKVLDVMQADARNLVHAMRQRQEQAIEMLTGERLV